MIKKVKGGYTIVHCHGKKKGKRIASAKKPMSYAKAYKMHRAIQASKHRKG